MATSWKSQQGNGEYSLQFETDDKEKYKLVEKAAQMAVDGKTISDYMEPHVKLGKETYALAYTNRRVIKVRVYQVTICSDGLEIWIENIDKPSDYWILTYEQYQKSASFETEEDAIAARNS